MVIQRYWKCLLISFLPATQANWKKIPLVITHLINLTHPQLQIHFYSVRSLQHLQQQRISNKISQIILLPLPHSLPKTAVVNKRSQIQFVHSSQSLQDKMKMTSKKLKIMLSNRKRVQLFKSRALLVSLAPCQKTVIVKSKISQLQLLIHLNKMITLLNNLKNLWHQKIFLEA